MLGGGRCGGLKLIRENRKKFIRISLRIYAGKLMGEKKNTNT